MKTKKWLFTIIFFLQSTISLALVHNRNYDFEIKVDEIENQQKVGLCWAYSANGTIINWMNYKEEVKNSTQVDLDENYLWYLHIKKQFLDNLISFDPIVINEGGHFFNVLDYIKTDGAIPEGVWKPKVKLNKDQKAFRIFNEKLHFLNLEIRNDYYLKNGFIDANHFKFCSQQVFDLRNRIFETSRSESEKIIRLKSDINSYINICQTKLTAEEKINIKNRVNDHYSGNNPENKLLQIPNVINNDENIKMDTSKFESLITEYFGEIPKQFKYKGKLYTPITFANENLKALLTGKKVTVTLELPFEVINESKKLKIEKIIKKYLESGRELVLSYFHLKSMENYYAPGVISSQNIVNSSGISPSFTRKNLYDIEIIINTAHAVRIVGYDEDETKLDSPLIKLKIANSWGKKAGDKGYHHMYMDYFWIFSYSIDFHLDLENADDQNIHNELQSFLKSE